ncbi:MAG: hypothetical protein LBS77_04070 [Desulfovibrio sp.]|nr:hypothetical protein [Desulfovibrio sp.]
MSNAPSHIPIAVAHNSIPNLRRCDTTHVTIAYALVKLFKIVRTANTFWVDPVRIQRVEFRHLETAVFVKQSAGKIGNILAHFRVRNDIKQKINIIVASKHLPFQYGLHILVNLYTSFV